jgi:hypothetical protein
MQFGNLFLLGLGADGEPFSYCVLIHARRMDTGNKRLARVGHSRG